MAPREGAKKRRIMLTAASLAAGVLMLFSPLRRLLGQVAMAALLAYRFTEGNLKGQSFGNLLLAISKSIGILQMMPSVTEFPADGISTTSPTLNMQSSFSRPQNISLFPFMSSKEDIAL